MVMTMLIALNMSGKCGQPCFVVSVFAEGKAMHLMDACYVDPYPFSLNAGDSLQIEIYMSGGIICGSPEVTLMRGEEHITVFMPPYGFPILRVAEPGVYTVWANTTSADAENTMTFTVIPSNSSRLALEVLLDGPFLYGSLMSSALSEHVPNIEPYSSLGYNMIGSGGEIVTDSALNNLGILDWVLIEFRDPFDPSSLIATRTALLDRGGRTYSPSTLSRFISPQPGQNYYVAVRHRNHLGVMTASPIAVNNITSVVDFTSIDVQTYGSDARKIVGQTALLWAGNVSMTATPDPISYIGVGNDRDAILQRIGANLPNQVVVGYYTEDANLDGVVKYTGANNDRDLILQSIGGTVPHTVRWEQLPRSSR